MNQNQVHKNNKIINKKLLQKRFQIILMKKQNNNQPKKVMIKPKKMIKIQFLITNLKIKIKKKFKLNP